MDRKTPVTFMMSVDLLNKVDQYIELRRIKSRSKYIVELIEKDLSHLPDLNSLGDFDKENMQLIK